MLSFYTFAAVKKTTLRSGTKSDIVSPPLVRNSLNFIFHNESHFYTYRSVLYGSSGVVIKIVHLRYCLSLLLAVLGK